MGFKFLLILDLWGVSFHDAIVFGLGKHFLLKSTLGHFGERNRALTFCKKRIFINPILSCPFQIRIVISRPGRTLE